MPTVYTSIKTPVSRFAAIAVFLTICSAGSLAEKHTLNAELTNPSASTVVRPMAEWSVQSESVSKPPVSPQADQTQVPDDRYVRQQWSLHGDQQYPGASGLFDAREFLTGASEIIVAVVDSGVLLNHEDLHFLPGYDFIHDANVANDGDGRDHDPSDPGDWVNEDDLNQNLVSQGCPLAASKWHGTAIAGVIGATAYNAEGIAGGAPSVALLPVRVTGKCGGYVADLIDGIRWAAGLTVQGVADNPHPAQVINLSVGFPGSCSNALQTAINDAVNAGAMVVTASTNTGVELDTEPYSPASCDNLITVAATDREGAITSYSALGQSVSISAPGGTVTDGIITTQNDGSELPLDRSSYGYHYGTSIAAAHVSAAIANLLSYQPTLTKMQIEQLLFESATSTDDDSLCKNNACGTGRLNAAEAIRMLASGLFPQNDEDAIPVQLAATNGNGMVDEALITSPSGDSATGIGNIDVKFLLLLLAATFAIRYRRSY